MCNTISIHALLAESDVSCPNLQPQLAGFLSTLSLRRATKGFWQKYYINKFLSTLSLRRATKKGSGKSTTLTNFYPRSPCGERRDGDDLYTLPLTHFYPRSPCGERHDSGMQPRRGPLISIHALLAESDTMQVIVVVVDTLFLSTLSLRRATIRGIVLKR